MSIKDTLKGIVAGEQQMQAANPAQAVATKAANVPVDPSIFEGLPTGYENVTSKDLIIPRLVILQGLSPQLDKNKPEFIPGASSGDFCDVATGEVWKEGIKLLPCYYATVYLEWAPRASGKGLVANHGTDAERAHKHAQLNEEKRWVTKEGNIISETATFFVLNISAGGRRSFVPMVSTQLKNARQWMTIITNEKLKRKDGSVMQAPLFYRSWEAFSVGQSNAKGSWNGWKFRPGETILELGGKALLDEAVDFNKQAKEGLVQGDFAGEEAAEDTDKM